MFTTKSLTGSGITYQKVGYVNGYLLRPSQDGLGVEATAAPKVAEALKTLDVPTDQPVELQYKLDGEAAHFQWQGEERNRKYGAAFDVPNPFVAPTKSAASVYLTEDEMAD